MTMASMDAEDHPAPKLPTPSCVGLGSGDSDDTFGQTQPYSLERDDSGDQGDWGEYFDQVMKKSSVEKEDSVLDSEYSSNCTEIETLECGDHISRKRKHEDEDSNGKCAKLCNGDSQVAGSSTLPAPVVNRNPSIEKEANQIATMLDAVKDLDVIYKRLHQLEDKENRVDLVSNELLEGGIDHIQVAIQQEEERKEQCGSDDIFSDIKMVMECISEKYNDLKVDPNEIYTLLEEYRSSEDRVKSTVNHLIENKNKSIDLTNSPPEEVEGIMKDVTELGKKFPQADLNEVFSLLDERSSKPDRVVLVSNLLAKQFKTKSPDKLGPSITDQIQKADGNNTVENELMDSPLYRETVAIASMFPDKDINEIYAYLDAHYHDPKRVEVVTEELLQQQRGSQDSMTQKQTLDTSGSSVESLVPPLGEKSHPASHSPQKDNVNGGIETIEDEIEMLRSIFPDCDPNYLYERLERMPAVPGRANRLTSELFETKTYPKVKSVEAEKSNAFKEKLLKQMNNTKMDNIEEFLVMFPDPETAFSDMEKIVTENYKKYATTQLRNEFPLLQATYITKKMTEHKNHFLPTLRDLERVASAYARNRDRLQHHKRFRKSPRTELEPFPEEPDEFFCKELLYARNEQMVKDHIKKQKDDREQRIKEAKDNGELQECSCCYDDEVLFEDMSTCPEGHLFCRECIRRSAEELVGQAKITFPCLAGDCDKEFDVHCLQEVLSPKTFSLILRKSQEEEIRQANIEDLVNCPFCNFATIMPNPDDKVFKCLNPECLRESCRLCSEPNHIPLRCDEVEKQGESSMRAFIENKMTEAMLRTCWRCKKRFFKTEGCNKMTCTCGAAMCYVCRKPVKDYSHFGGSGCPQDTDVQKLHIEEMQKAMKFAREKYEEEHPEAAGKELKFDPSKHLGPKANHGPQLNPRHALFMAPENDEDDEDDEEDNYDDDEVDEEDYEDDEYPEDEHEDPGDEEFNRAINNFLQNNHDWN